MDEEQKHCFGPPGYLPTEDLEGGGSRPSERSTNFDRCPNPSPTVIGQPSEALSRPCDGFFYADQFLKRNRALQLVAGVTDLREREVLHNLV